ncbi:MAG: MYG1 family protein [Chlamydiales bacterium]
MDKEPRSFGTHDGTFHADEVTACALLLYFGLIDREKIVRTRIPEILARCEYVCDVGLIYDPEQKLFDHHQADYIGPLSSAGMVLQYLKDKAVIDKGVYDYLNNSLILGVDAHDNGRGYHELGYCSFSHVVSNFTPYEYDVDPEISNRTFNEALDFVLGHLNRLKERYDSMNRSREVILKAMDENKDYLIFHKAMPWMDIFFEEGGESHPALFIVMPTKSHWKLRGIPPSYDERMKVRYPLPEEWAGLSGEDLQRASGIPGGIFCHKGRFISVWETKADAMKALEQVLSTVKGRI